MAAGMLYNGSCNQTPRGAQDQAKQYEIALVNGVPVYAEDVERVYAAGMQRMGMTTGVPPEMEAQFLASAVQQSTNQALLIKLAKDQGAKFDDEELRTVLKVQFEEGIPAARAQMVAQGMLKDGATDAQFDEAIKKQTGKTLAELRADNAKNIEESLKDPSRRSLAVAGAAQALLEQGIKAKLQPTDDLLKASYNTYIYKRILLRKDQGTETPATRATKIAGELSAKTLTFDQAMDRYSGDLPEPGKKLSQVPARSASAAMVQAQPELAPLLKLKAGEVSSATDGPEGTVIYQLETIRSDVPKDFEANKAKYRSQYIAGASQVELEKSLTEARKTIKIEWKSKSYKALYDWVKLMQDNATADPAAKETALLAIAKEAAASREDVGAGGDVRAAVLAEYGAFSTAFRAATPERKKSLSDERIKAIEALLSITESIELRLDLASVYADKNDGENAFNQVLAAAQANNYSDPAAEANDRNISGRTIQLNLKKLLTAEQEAAITKEQARFRAERDEAKKQEAEQKKQDEIQRKALEEEQKKAAAAAKSKPAPGLTPPPGTPPSQSPSTGGGFLPKTSAGN
ncbi:MAG: hypothetical protein ACOYON_03845 [Fimbriimonas sp.]